jgi:LmbE family N-acetylglucosaminyl deacetylase
VIGLAIPGAGRLRVLAIGAHPDDIEIGAGGLLLELLGGDRDLALDWIVLSGDDVRADEARASAAALVGNGAELSIEVAGFRERYFPHHAALKEHFDELGRRLRPDLILSPRREDRHQDHAVVANLAWQTFRDHLILEYEIPKYEGDLGQPNVFVPLSADTVERKISHLMAAFPSQRQRSWFTADAFRGLLRLRGIESNAASGFAEGFAGTKLALALDRRPAG